MNIPTLLGVNLPQTNRLKLKSELRQLTKNQKATLYFLYSEFVLRANKNPFYRQILNKTAFGAIDGQGLHWSMWRVIRPSFLVKIYTKFLVKLPFWLRFFLFYLIFFAQLFLNLLYLTIFLVFRLNLNSTTKNQLILGRDFVYDLLDLAESNGWKTLIVGGNDGNSKQILQTITTLYPKLEIDFWGQPKDSNLMKDIPNQDFSLHYLNPDNLFDFYPDLQKAKNYIELYKPDLILVCLGGASGKQEFFIHDLYSDPNINFTLTAGLGAALDHIGSGAKQSKAPRWLVLSGLEWLYRFFTLPYRRKRIINSVLGLWWYTTIDQFVRTNQTTKQFVNIIKSDDNKFLVQIKNSEAEFLVEPIRSKESVKRNYLNTKKKTNLDFKLLDFDPKPTKLASHRLSKISLLNWQKLRFKFDTIEPFLCFVNYPKLSHSTAINRDFEWLDQKSVESKINPHQRQYWQDYIVISELNSSSDD